MTNGERVMMSIRSLGSLGAKGGAAKAAAHYYDEKSADYYVRDKAVEQEEAGRWIGEGAKRLELKGGPDKQELQLSLAGYLEGRRVQNAGEPSRKIGWDMTFSAPKSVSVAWAFANATHRNEIMEAHLKAAQAA